MPTRIVVLILLLVALLPGCAGRAWREAREQDSITAYHRFLRQHPESEFAQEARARLELSRIRKKPTREAYEKFQRKYSDPGLVAELRPYLEEAYFRYARAVASSAAYREFLEEFADGQFSARARGNAEYIEAGGFGGNVEVLADFAARHPESDYAAEAERSVAAVAARARSGFQRVGLVLAVHPSTPGGDRVWRVLRDRAVAAYRAAGLEVALLDDPSRAAEAGLAAVLQIRHEERETTTQLEDGEVAAPSVVSRTELSLARVGDAEPIWADAFEYRVPVSAKREDASILFSAGSQSRFWSELEGEFFVPVARWSTHLSRRDPQTFPKPAVAVEVAGQRAVVLFGDGDFQLFDLGDPARPLRMGEYRRDRDLKSFDGVTIADTRVAIYGSDGVEIVRLDGESTRREAAFGRDVVGSVASVVHVGGVWLAGTNRGLLRLGGGPDEVVTLVPRPIPGMARAGERVVFTDGMSLYSTSLPLLQAGRVEAELRLGRGFGPGRVRVHGATAVVLGARDAVWVDLRQTQPRLLSRIGGNESGRVLDAAVIGNRLFLLGPRGLQVVDRRGEHIVDSVDVVPRQRIDVAGRHLVMIGEKSLQVVDATPFFATPPAARD